LPTNNTVENKIYSLEKELNDIQNMSNLLSTKRKFLNSSSTFTKISSSIRTRKNKKSKESLATRKRIKNDDEKDKSAKAEEEDDDDSLDADDSDNAADNNPVVVQHFDQLMGEMIDKNKIIHCFTSSTDNNNATDPSIIKKIMKKTLNKQFHAMFDAVMLSIKDKKSI
jgi:hypothetical protein